LGDFGPTFVGGGQEDVEERVEVVAHIIVGVSVLRISMLRVGMGNSEVSGPAL
jgi:hypothetical protein